MIWIFKYVLFSDSSLSHQTTYLWLHNKLLPKHCSLPKHTTHLSSRTVSVGWEFESSLAGSFCLTRSPEVAVKMWAREAVMRRLMTCYASTVVPSRGCQQQVLCCLWVGRLSHLLGGPLPRTAWASPWYSNGVPAERVIQQREVGGSYNAFSDLVLEVTYHLVNRNVSLSPTHIEGAGN